MSRTLNWTDWRIRFYLLSFLDLDDDGIAAVRDAKIVTRIDVSDDGEVSVATSDAESSDDPNVVTFTPGVETNITNPLNGETVSVGVSWRELGEIFFCEIYS